VETTRKIKYVWASARVIRPKENAPECDYSPFNLNPEPKILPLCGGVLSELDRYVPVPQMVCGSHEGVRRLSGNEKDILRSRFHFDQCAAFCFQKVAVAQHRSARQEEGCFRWRESLETGSSAEDRVATPAWGDGPVQFRLFRDGRMFRSVVRAASL
jgi:hypothetical protein